MEIDSLLAQRIVNSIKEVVQYEINFFNLDATIIASTDLDRIGHIHEGAKEVIERNEDVIIKKKDYFVGAKEGYNTAVYIENQMIGVVGITGSPVEVMKYADIIRKLTELIISEAFIAESSFNHRLHQKSVIDYVLGISSDLKRKPLLSDYHIEKNRRVLFTTYKSMKEQLSDLYSIVRMFFSHRLDFISVNETSMILLIYNREESVLTDLINQLVNYLSNNYHVNLTFGIGRICNDQSSSILSFEEAKFGCKWLEKDPLQSWIFYEHMTIERLFIDLNLEQINSLSDKVLGNLNTNELIEYQILLNTYEKYNGSLKESAHSLYIHKNTLQYRLNKLYELTGYNPRNLSDFVVLKLAFIASKIKKPF